MPSSQHWALATALFLCTAGATPAAGEVFLSKQEALAAVFPDADHTTERTIVLDQRQVDEIESLAKSPIESQLVTIYTGMRGDRVLGYAFIDVHTVRTLPEAFLVVLDPEGIVRTTRMLAFYEPKDYLPPERWLRQFDEHGLEPTLRLGGDIHGIAGSTLSSRAVMGGVRRALATYRVVLQPRETPASGPALAAGQ